MAQARSVADVPPSLATRPTRAGRPERLRGAGGLAGILAPGAGSQASPSGTQRVSPPLNQRRYAERVTGDTESSTF